MSHESSLVLRGRVVTPTAIIGDGVVHVAAGRIAAVSPAGSEPSPAQVVRAAWILPGFVDLHTHGGGGHDVMTTDASQAQAVAAFHHRHGTTTMLASLTSTDRSTMRAISETLAPLVEAGAFAGLHYEGPYLSPARRGAHPLRHLRDPDLAELAHLLELAPVRMLTLAPELPGALQAIGLLVERDVVAAVGHTDAGYEQTWRAIEAGARVGTHLFNGMPPLHHRAPGAVAALLEAPAVVVELIADGVHLHDATVRHVLAHAGPDRVALVSDAIGLAGLPDGGYRVAGRSVTVSGAAARFSASGRLAGGLMTLDKILPRIVHSGVTMVDAAIMLATTPAGVLGLAEELGAIVSGRRADLVCLDEDLAITTVLRHGIAIELR